jgi:flagellar basal body P-ring formation protein FlgA
MDCLIRIIFNFLKIGVTAALLCGAVIHHAQSSASFHIRLPAQAMVDAETIHLGRIAQISGGPAGQADALQSIEVGRVSHPGQSVLIHRSQIEMRLKQNGIDPELCRIEDQGPVKVLRSHAVLTSEKIRETVTAFIKAHAPWDHDQMVIRPIQYQQDHVLPSGRANIEIAPPKHTDWLGAIPFRVTIIVEGKPVHRINVPAYIEVWQEVLLAAKPLGRNQPITPADIRTEKMNLARIPANALLRMDQVLGRRANRSIAINSVLRADQIDTPPVVRKGNVVQVLAESAQVKISTLGVAQEDGAIGAHIRVMNIASRKHIHARVLDSQTVQVGF